MRPIRLLPRRRFSLTLLFRRRSGRWGSGTGELPYLVSPLEALQAWSVKENKIVRWTLDNWDLASVNKTATYADAAIVFIGSNSGEREFPF